MRFGTLLLVLLSPLAWAQTPDTIAAERYLPLPHGAVWEYEHWYDDCSLFPVCQTHVTGHVQHRVVADSMVGGFTYAVVRTQAGLVELVRFDSTAAHGVVRQADGSESYWPSLAPPCPLNGAFDTWVTCEDGEGAYVSQQEFTITEGGHPVSLFAKAIDRFGSHSASYVAGLGLVNETRGDIGGAGSYLVYAQVGGRTYGSPVVAGENGPMPATMVLSVAPNPVRGATPLRLQLLAGSAVRVEAFDALGRRMHADFGGHPVVGGTITLDVGAWLPGLYVVRVTASDGRAATARVVRVD